MLLALFSLAKCLSPFSEHHLIVSFSGLHLKNNNFSSKLINGFHTCHGKMNTTVGIREKMILLSFEILNETHYISRHCTNYLMYQKDILHIKSMIENGYLNFNVNTKTEIVDISDEENNLFNEFLITISNDNFQVKPINKLILDVNQPAILSNVSFYLKFDDFIDNSNYIKNEKTQSDFTPTYIAFISLFSFLPAIVLCYIYSRNIKSLPQMAIFYKITVFTPNTLLFGTNGLIQFIQIILYFITNSLKFTDGEFNYQLYRNLFLVSLLFPTALRIFQGNLFNVYTQEADFISASLVSIFFTDAPLSVLVSLNYLFFHSFRFSYFLYGTINLFFYLILIFVCGRGIGYLTKGLIPETYKLGFQKQTGNVIISWPSTISMILFGLFSLLCLAKAADHLILVGMNYVEFDFHLVFSFFIVFMAFTSLYSTIRTNRRIESTKISWLEDHLLYGFIGSFCVTLFMTIDALFIRGIKGFEMFVHIAVVIYSTFGLLFTTSTGISFFFAFIQCYFSVIKPHIQ
ncbi:hypothetical protein TRFO_31527 [Tritrichomonas foetus]|uniref:Uncharacterized protein n=1 Tax=Tritrichomonas foetus TaxID=1144522 RepID=A0A1J4JRA0_9EUKA|nr:hypothetical protein TRFO_31527 [Tritrichomonas foetus]|eukprot:OHT01641.1 hypothetical protein TRFO_31527 [Tritrichomonas foetus]